MLSLRIAAVCACLAATMTPRERAAAEPAVTGRIDVPAPGALAINPGTGLLYVAGLREVSVVNLQTDRVEHTIDVRGRPSDVALNPKSDTIYVTSKIRCSKDCWPRGLLSVIDGSSSNQVVSEIRVGRSPGAVAVNVRTNHVFVANYNSENVSVVDGDTNEVVSVVNPKLGYPHDLAVNSRTNRLYVTGSEKMSVLDIADGRIIWMGSRASGYDLQVEVDAAANRVYLTDQAGSRLLILDGSSHRVIRPIELSQEPVDVALYPANDLIYATTRPDFYSDDEGELVSVDAESLEIVARTPISEGAWRVTVNSETLRAYISDDLADTVWVVSEDSSGGQPTPPITGRTIPDTAVRGDQKTPMCDGKAATKVGTRGDDVLRGTRRRDVIVGLGGDDVIRAGRGRDTICGNRGADHLFGGDGIDAVIGGLGRDRLEERYVGGGNSLDGSGGRDLLSYLTSGPVVVLLGPGEAAAGCPRNEFCPDDWDPDFLSGIEIVVGSPYDDNLVGDGQDNLLRGKRGRDHLRGKGGDDRLFGEIDRDSLNGGNGIDELFGGKGRDRCSGEMRHRC